MANLPFDLKGKTVYVAGHRGMVGSALVRRLAQLGGPRPRWRMASGSPIKPISARQVAAELKACQRRYSSSEIEMTACDLVEIPPIRFPAADTIDASSTYHA